MNAFQISGSPTTLRASDTRLFSALHVVEEIDIDAARFLMDMEKILFGRSHIDVHGAGDQVMDAIRAFGYEQRLASALVLATSDLGLALAGPHAEQRLHESGECWDRFARSPPMPAAIS